MIWYIISLLLLLCCVPFAYLCIKYRNPYKLIMVFGKKGSGKTTYLCRLAQEFLAVGRPVYSTESIPGTYKIEPEDVGFVQFPKEAVILMDEVGMIYDNRQYKSFKTEVRDYFKLQRHYHHTVYLFSQTFDIDIKLRNLTDSMFLLVNYFGWLSYAKEIRRKIVVVKPSEDCESRLADELVIPHWFTAIFGTRKFIFVPRWAKMFNSFVAPELAHKDYELTEYPDDMPESLLPRRLRKLRKQNKQTDPQGA